jgi:ABC-type transport system substrate-binding protein
MSNRRAICIAVPLLVGILLVASGAAASRSSRTATNSTIVFQELAPPNTLDPQKSLDDQDMYAWELSYQCLLQEGTKGNLLPQLATHWTESANGRVYTFTLRKGVFFHNNASFTSADVVYTFNRLEKRGIPYAQDQFPNLKRVRADGPYRVTFTLSQANPGFLFSMANPLVVGCAIMTSHPGKLNMSLNMIGTGPYAMTRYAPNQEMDLTAFPKYWGSKPANGGLQVLYVPDQNTEVSNLEAGKADIMIVDPSIEKSLKSMPGIKIYSTPPNTSDLLFINSAIKPWSDVRVRRAIALAIDRKAIADVAYDGHAISTSFLPSSFSWAVPFSKTAYHNQNLLEAKQLLAAAGYPNGIKGQLMWEIGLSPEVNREMALVQSQLAKIGIKLKLDPEQVAVWSDKFNKPGRLIPKYDLSWNDYGIFADPWQYLRLRPDRQGPVPPKLQSMIDKLPSAKNVNQYFQMLNGIAKMEADLAYPAVPLVRFSTDFAARSNLTGVVPPANLSRTFLAGIAKS